MITKRSWILIAACLTVLAAGGTAGAVWYGKRTAVGAKHRLAQAADAAAAAGQWRQAFTLYAQLAQDEPRPEILRAAAQAAWRDQRKPEARHFAERAWAAGAHDREVLGMLLADVGQEDRAAMLATARKRIAELTDPQARQRLEADALADFGDRQEAVSAWIKLCTDQPSAEHALVGAQMCLDHGQPAQARTLLEVARKSGTLNAEGWHLLVTVVQMSNAAVSRPEQVEPIAPLFSAARAADAWDARLELDEAFQFWMDLSYEDALKAQRAIGRNRKDPLSLRSQRGGRLLAAVMLGELDRSPEIASLASDLPPGSEAEGEARLYRTLATDAPGVSLERITRAERLIGNQPLLDLIHARMLAKTGDRAAAQALLQGLPGLIATAPSVVLDRARLLAGLDRTSEAVGAVLDLHRQRGPTRRSLLLLAELTLGSEPGPLVDAVQESLREAGRRDPGMAASAAAYALHRGNTALAKELSASMRTEHVENSQTADLVAIRASIQAGDGAEALRLCEQSTSPVGSLAPWRGLALVLLNRPSEALIAFAAADPDRTPAPALIAEADLAQNSGDLDRARRVLLRASKLLPGPTYRRLALIDLRAGNAKEALRQIDLALAAEPDHTASLAIKALAFAALDRRDEALASAARVLAQRPGDPDMSRLRADLLMASNHATEAIQTLEQAIARPDHPVDLVQRLIEIHLLTGDVRAAEGLVPRLGAQPDPVLLMRLKLANGDLEGARKALDALPDSVPIGRRSILGAELDRRQGRTDLALARLAPLLGSDPEVAVAWASLALMRTPNPTPVAPVLATLSLPTQTLVDLGVVAEQADNWPECNAILAIALAAAPNDPVVNNNWAWAAWHVPGTPIDTVLAAVERARQALPAAEPVLDTWAQLHNSAGRHRQVVDRLEAIADVTNRSALLLHHLGIAREALGERKEAHAAYVQASELARKVSKWPLPTSEPDLRRRVEKLKPQ